MADPLWKKDPEKHDFPAAVDYLELLMSPHHAKAAAERLKEAPTVQKKAKDILRASELPLLPEDNVHVADNIGKVRAGHKLSPVLLLRGQPLVIADGYHRVCAVYYLSEDLEIPCRVG
ncbi:hypothetical protein AB0D08_15080 [Kitasatospora sp. NPDC048540]|uniref:hypothetical protein n=1 Tax=unclassified Kitasatospora TaxID=2633591 RepID=UPI00053A5516|nr:hypothetical protein [Kitasatospora sp. MBT63]